jgi:hypothetical protein
MDAGRLFRLGTIIAAPIVADESERTEQEL